MARVLIIEDMQEVRELLEIFLSKEGFIVFSTPSGEKGIDLVRKNTPDLVLLDIKLPDLGGLEVLKKIREFDKTTRIVMLSGLNTEELEKEARQAGASGFLSKSLGVEGIIKAVSAMLL